MALRSLRFLKLILIGILLPQLTLAQNPNTHLQNKDAVLQVAVASNFRPVIQKLAPIFADKTGIKIIWTSASSGAIYSQIMQGAPIDVFLSADSDKPLKLIQNNLAQKDSLITYAVGQLVWYQPGFRGNPFAQNKTFKSRIVFANPKIAPYGKAALEVMQSLKLKSIFFQKKIETMNILQAFQYIQTGNVAAGFVSYSQIIQQRIKKGYWLIPDQWHHPIEQQAVIIKNHKKALSRRFLEFLLSNPSQKIIQDMGYLSR